MLETRAREQRRGDTPESSGEHSPPATGLDNKVSVFGYLCLCLNVFFFSSLIAAEPGTFHALTREDYWVEYLTAVWLLLAGLLVFGTAWLERRFFQRCVYILGGMAMAFAAGEEISWGQRIFGFATPDFLMPLNEQKEFTVHNIANGMFDIIYLNGTLILCMATSAAFFCRKGRLFGIPLPSILLMLGFLVIVYYDSWANLKEIPGAGPRGYLTFIRQSFGFIVVEEKGLLLLFLIFTLISGQVKLFIASAATLALILALSYVNYHYHSNVFGSIGSLFEVREYLFGIGCLFYSLELLLAQGRLAAISPALFSGLKPRGVRIPFWLMTCSLAIAGSIGLMLFAYFKLDSLPHRSRLVGDNQPAVRSDFDVYPIENSLIYVKEPCAHADAEPMFFLHLFPVDADDLPDHRKQYGYDNLDFDFDQRGARFDGRCSAKVPLPKYGISEMRTG